MPSAARNSLIGGYTSWSEPLTSKPLCLSSAASVAVAVPQMPMMWTRLLNSGLFDHETRAFVRDDPTRHAQRQRHRRTGRVSRRKPDEHRPRKIAQQIGHHRTPGGIAGGLVAPWQLAH